MSTEAKPEYSPGLAGVIAGETAICWVDPNAGLMYRGYDIHEMGDKATFEEVAYLLLNGELPNGKQLNEFKQQIASQRELPEPVVQMLGILPKSTHPMDMLRTGVSILSAFDKDLSDNSHDDPTDRARFDVDHRWLADFARRKAIAGKTRAQPGGQFLLQIERKSSGNVANANAGHDFQFVCRP